MNHCERAWKYAEDVVAGKIPAGRYVKLQCQRSLNWREGNRYYFDEDAAHVAANFMESFPHTKGKWASRRNSMFFLEDWQCFLICMVFGWMREDGRRVIRSVRLYVARKNGKSELAARIGLYMLAADGEHCAEVYCGATSEDQAHHVFAPAHRMTSQTPEFREYYGIQAMKKSITCTIDDGSFRTVIGKPGDGGMASCHIADEYHEHDDDVQMEALAGGMGGREQPLQIVTSTAGENIGGPCDLDWEECTQILEGNGEDDTLFALIYAADVPKDDEEFWKTDVALMQANPNLGVSVEMEDLERERNKALKNARKIGVFKTKKLNIWVGALEAFFNTERWKQNARLIKPKDFRGCDAFLASDLASKIDLATTVALVDCGDAFKQYKGCWAAFARAYVPEAANHGRNAKRYRNYNADDRLIFTQGNVIDFERIEDDIREWFELFNVISWGYDQYNAVDMATRINKDVRGIEILEYGQTMKNFSDPMKDVEAMILCEDGKGTQLINDDDPCFRWQMGNVVAFEDTKSNVMPRKRRNENKIDSAVALIMANGLRKLHDAKPKKRVIDYKRGQMHT